MRRLYETGIILILLLVSMNSFIYAFGGMFQKESGLQDVSPSKTETISLLSAIQSGKASIFDIAQSFVRLPFEIAGAITQMGVVILNVFTAHEAMFKAIGLTQNIINPISMVLRTVILVVVIGTIIDLVSALRGTKA